MSVVWDTYNALLSRLIIPVSLVFHWVEVHVISLLIDFFFNCCMLYQL